MLKKTWESIKRVLSPSPKKYENKIFFYNHPSITNDSKIFRYEGLITKATVADEVHLDIAKQARAVVASTGIIQGALQTLKSEILGERGIVVDVNTDNNELNETVEKRFNYWCRDVGAGKTFFKFQQEILHQFYVDGEAFIILQEEDKNRLSLQVLDTFRLSQYVEEKKRIYYGIKYDKFGNPVTYYFENRMVSHTMPFDLQAAIKVPAEQVIHLKYGYGKRGISVLAPVIDMTYDSLNLVKEELRRGIISSQLVGFMKTPANFDAECGILGSGMGVNNITGELVQKKTPDKKEEGYGIEPGTLPVLPSGMEPVFSSPAEPPELEKFLKAYFYHLGGALGLTYPTLTGDLSEINYSSIRAGSLKERRQYGVIQTTLIQEVLNKVFECWIKHPSNYGGKSEISGIMEEILMNYTFKTPTWQHVDPVKEANSIKVQLEQGVLTLTEVLKARGKDVNEHYQELEQDLELVELVAAKNTMMDEVADNELPADGDSDESKKGSD